MELWQCVSPSEGSGPHNRAYHSEDRDIHNRKAATLGSTEKVRRASQPHQPSYNTLSHTGRDRRASSSSSGGVKTSGFRHYGSSLTLAEEHSAQELTRRTLRPPSPTTLRKSSAHLPPSAGMKKAERHPRPSLPDMRVELESPRLADYLERPRLVNSVRHRNESTASVASAHHAKRHENMAPNYRNLRLGNFMEQPHSEEELIPERLRQYYLDTYLNVCDKCDSLNHCNPLSPIHRGM